MTWSLSTLAICGALAACGGTPLTQATFPDTGRIDDDADRYIVAGVNNEESSPGGRAGSSPKGYDSLTLYGPTSRAARLLRAIERDYGLREVKAWPIAPLHMHCAVLEISAHEERAAVIAALLRDQRVRIAQPLQTFTTQTSVYDDPYVGLQRGFQQLEVPGAHELSRGAGVRIAIVDTGVDTQHPDLRGVIVKTANFVDADDAQFRRDRHGTELAGIIAAVANNGEGIVGIAPGARLAVYKACWQLSADADAARCNSFTLARALTAALDDHAQIVNLSLAGPPDPLLRELLVEALRRGVLVVGAAPPDQAGRSVHFLGVDGVLTVTNAGLQGDGGPLHAPGQEILTLLPGGHYDYASGTSLSTAHVTGTVALLLEIHPHLTAAAAYRVLHDTTRHGLYAGSADSINACAAVSSLLGHGACGAEGAAESRMAMH